MGMLRKKGDSGAQVFSKQRPMQYLMLRHSTVSLAICGHSMMIDKHTLAPVSIVGCSLDVLGALYLAYDLLGGEHGRLRTLTMRGHQWRPLWYRVRSRSWTGCRDHDRRGARHHARLGVLPGFEAWTTPGFWKGTAMSAIRGVGFALGTAYIYGARFGIAFGALSTLGQVIAYRLGLRPDMDYRPATRPRLTKTQLLAAANRTVGYAIAGYVSALLAQQRANALTMGIRAGLMMGVVTAIVVACTPFIEWTADDMPERRMGVLGIGLILIGFTLQSVQYWVALLDVNIANKTALMLKDDRLLPWLIKLQ